MARGPVGSPWRRRRRPTPGALVPAAPAAPDTPSAPSPATAGVAYYTVLSWVSARATKFDVYLDTVNPPTTIVAPKWNTASYVPTLAAGTTYYWKVVAFNDGGSAVGPVWSFTTPAATAVLISMAGAIVTARARADSLSIREALGTAPNTASLTFDTVPPTGGEAITIGLGTLDADRLIFGGEVQFVDQTCIGTPAASSIYPVTLIDQTFRLNKRRPFGTWTNVSASTIARYLVATFAPGFTSTHVADNLPAVTINFDGSQDFMTCLRALATAIGDTVNPGKTKVDYTKDVWLYLTYAGESPDAITDANPPLQTPAPIRFSVDYSQLRTRGYGKGHGEALLCDVGLGETILPIADAVMFNPIGGQAIASATADGAQTTICSYAGTRLVTGGAIVGPGASPSVAPNAKWSTGAGLSDGTYQYAYTDVTATGESLPSPLRAIAIGSAPSAPPVYSVQGPGNGIGTTGDFTIGDTVEFVYVYSQAPTVLDFSLVGGISGSSGVQTLFQDSPGFYRTPVLTLTYSTDPNVAWLYTFVSKNGGPFLHFANGSNANNTAGGTLQRTFDGRQDAQGVPTPARQSAVSAIAIGASAVTSRKLYRTAVGGSQLKLLTTIADNVTTTYTDSTADASLGANAPTSDASGLTQIFGQILPGATSLLLVSAGPFFSTGGWVTLPGTQTVRYTGINGNNLIGIPASGAGSITTAVTYGTQALPTPSLVGVNQWNGIGRALAKGSKVNVWVQRDDLAAQAALGQLELDETGVASDGIREYLIVDERSTEARMAALCDADLALFSRPIVTAEYSTRDRKSKTGRTVSIALTTNGVTTWAQAGAFTIQRVELSFDGPALNPRYAVTATSSSFTLRDLLRRVVLT
jgi:hypothetical protein